MNLNHLFLAALQLYTYPPEELIIDPSFRAIDMAMHTYIWSDDLQLPYTSNSEVI